MPWRTSVCRTRDVLAVPQQGIAWQKSLQDLLALKQRLFRGCSRRLQTARRKRLEVFRFFVRAFCKSWKRGRPHTSSAQSSPSRTQEPPDLLKRRQEHCVLRRDVDAVARPQPYGIAALLRDGREPFPLGSKTRALSSEGSSASREHRFCRRIHTSSFATSECKSIETVRPTSVVWF